jgi:stage V sporulation protein G
MSALKITNIQVFPLPGREGKLRAFARVTLNDELVLTGLRVYEGIKGLFVSYPNDPSRHQEDYRQLFFPVSKEFRDHVEQTVLEHYAKSIQE